MFVSQITWWVPHVFVWRSPKRSKMSSSAYNVPHTKYMWTSTWPGLAGFGVLPADGVHARPPYSTCRPGHLPRGSVPPGVPDEAVLLSKAPGGPHIFYMADELILERFGLRHTNTWGIHHVIWLTNICIFFKIARAEVSGYERGTDGEWMGGLMYLAGAPFREKGNGRGTDTCIWLRAC